MLFSLTSAPASFKRYCTTGRFPLYEATNNAVSPENNHTHLQLCFNVYLSINFVILFLSYVYDRLALHIASAVKGGGCKSYYISRHLKEIRAPFPFHLASPPVASNMSCYTPSHLESAHYSTFVVVTLGTIPLYYQHTPIAFRDIECRSAAPSQIFKSF